MGDVYTKLLILVPSFSSVRFLNFNSSLFSSSGIPLLFSFFLRWELNFSWWDFQNTKIWWVGLIRIFHRNLTAFSYPLDKDKCKFLQDSSKQVTFSRSIPIGARQLKQHNKEGNSFFKKWTNRRYVVKYIHSAWSLFSSEFLFGPSALPYINTTICLKDMHF